MVIAIKFPVKIHIHLILYFSIITKNVVITKFNPIRVSENTKTCVFLYIKVDLLIIIV